MVSCTTSAVPAGGSLGLLATNPLWRRNGPAFLTRQRCSEAPCALLREPVERRYRRILLCGSLLGIAAVTGIWLVTHRSTPTTIPPRPGGTVDASSDRIVSAMQQGLRHGHEGRERIAEPNEDTPFQRAKRLVSIGPLRPRERQAEEERKLQQIEGLERHIREMEAAGLSSTEMLKTHALPKETVESIKAQLDTIRNGGAFWSLTPPADMPEIPGYMLRTARVRNVRLDDDEKLITFPPSPPVTAPQEESLSWFRERAILKARPTVPGYVVFPIKLADYPELVAAMDAKTKVGRIDVEERAFRFNSLPFDERKRVYQEWRSFRALQRDLDRDTDLDPGEKQRRRDAARSRIEIELSGLRVNTRTWLARVPAR